MEMQDTHDKHKEEDEDVTGRKSGNLLNLLNDLLASPR